MAFVALKITMSSAPALGLPDYNKTFYLYSHKTGGFVQSVLTQQHGNKMWPIDYHSVRLDPVMRGFPPCLQAVAATSHTVQVTATIVLGNPLILRVPHLVSAVPLKAETQHLSASRATTYELVLLTSSNITIQRCPPLNRELYR